MNNELIWRENKPTLLQPGILIAQGIRRVYCIDSTLIGDNRFRAGIRRGCFVYWCNLPADQIEDAKSILQHDHDCICEAIAETCTPKWISVRDQLPQTENDYVLTLNLDTKVRRTAFWHLIEGFCVCYKKTSIPVTHWMPLPEPPK